VIPAKAGIYAAASRLINTVPSLEYWITRRSCHRTARGTDPVRMMTDVNADTLANYKQKGG
jgi:hypothetical protein